MAKNGFKIIDSDMHVMEPPELWEKYIDKKFRHRAPRGVTSHNVRDLRLVHPDGSEWSRKTTPSNDTAKGKNFEEKQNILGNDAARGWTSEVQLEAMDIEGIDIAVLYPTRGLRALVDERMDPEFGAAMARAYNDWMYDFCRQKSQAFDRRRHDFTIQHGRCRQRSAPLRRAVGFSRRFPARQPVGRSSVAKRLLRPAVERVGRFEYVGGIS